MAELTAWEEAVEVDEETTVRWEWRPDIAEKDEGDETDKPHYLETGQLLRMERDTYGTWQVNESHGYCDYDAVEEVIAEANDGVPLNKVES